MNRLTIQPYFFLALLLGVLAVVYFMFRPFLAVLALAAILAVALKPTYFWFKNRFNLGSRWGALIFSLLILVLLAAIFSLLLGRVFMEARGLYESLAGQRSGFWSDTIDRVESMIHAIAPEFGVNLRQYVGELANWLVGHLAALFSGTVGVVLKFFLLIIAFYFFLRDGTHLRRIIVELSPLGDEYDEQIITKLKQTINSVVKGFLLVAVIQGILVGIGLAIFGVPKAALWGSAAVFSALVPGVGTALVTLPAAIYLWATGHMLASIGLFVWAALLVGLVDNLLAPVLYSRGGTSHPFLMFLAVFGGLILFGPIGFILGPIFLSFLFALVEIYRGGIVL